MTNLDVTDDCLIFFIDETGHEELKGKPPLYALGGCAIMGRDLNTVIREPWREVRRVVGGSPDAQLHASKVDISKEEHVGTIANFFRYQSFARFGVMVTIHTKFHPTLPPLNTVTSALKNRIADIAQWQPFSEIAIIFEASRRADKLVSQAVGDVRIEVEGHEVPVRIRSMKKVFKEPALEVADFVVHSIQGQGKLKMKGASTFRKDFETVFHTVHPRLVSFIGIDLVIADEGGTSLPGSH